MKRAVINGQRSALSDLLFAIRCRSSCYGFTLIELLVVIAIIAILAGVLQPAIFGAITKGKITKARGEVHAIARAVEAYQQEYSHFPGQGVGDATADHFYDGDYAQLITVLCGGHGADARFSNSRNIVFLDVHTNSFLTISMGGTAQVGDLADLWGNRYYVTADWNFDNQIDSPNADGGSIAGRNVAVWSWGPVRNSWRDDPSDSSHIRSWK